MDWAAVNFSVPDSSLDSRLSSVSGSSYETELIVAVPGNTTSVGTSTFMNVKYDAQLLNPTNGSVSLSIPLNTSLRLVKAVFKESLTLGNIVINQPTAFCTGLSDTFAVSGSETKKTVEMTMDSLQCAKAFTSFSFDAAGNTALAADFDGNIRGTGIAVTPYTSDVTSLVATYTAGGTSVKIGDTLQISGVTTNDFSTPVTYTVTAADGTTQDYTVTVTKFSAVGIPDVTFNLAGIVQHHNISGGDGVDSGLTGIVDSSGRILAGGWSGGGADAKNTFIMRYSAEGTLDRSFGTNGIVNRNDSTGADLNEMIYEIVEDANGKILAVGYIYPGTPSDITVWRFNEDGSLDTSFASGGMFVHAGAAGGTGKTELGRGIALDSSGRIVIVGNAADNSALYHMVVLRLNTDGTLDTSFGTSGIVTYADQNGGDTSENEFKVALDAAGRILVAGSSDIGGGNQDMHLWRYNSDGSPDTSFDTDGLVIHGNAAGGNGDDIGKGITVDSNGRILVTGTSNNGTDDDIAIWRFNNDGSLDTTFGSNGIIVGAGVAGGSGNDYGNGIVIDAAGKILVASSSDNEIGELDLVILRFNTDGSPDSSFGLNGMTIFNNGYASSGSSISIDANGKIVVVGKSGNGSDDDLAIWRYE